MRTHYWSCTTLADRIRGTPKPTALEWDAWDSWHEEAKGKHPLRYWIAETLLDNLQAAIHWVPDKIDGVVYWWYTRWQRPTHVLRAHKEHIRPGTGWDFCDRLLPCVMSELVDFVEIDKALDQVRWDREAGKRYQAPWWLFKWPHIRGWRCRQAGLDYLDWEIGLGEESPDQAHAAREIKELYLWWTQTRPNRPDPYEATGWNKWSASQKGLGFTSREFDPDTKARVETMLDQLNKMEMDYLAEDKQQLHRVVDIYRRLW